MPTLIIHEDSKEKWEALEAFMKALKIKFETSKESSKTYNEDFVKKIQRGDKDVKSGNLKTKSLEDLWK
jgi:hypothetical protein